MLSTATSIPKKCYCSPREYAERWGISRMSVYRRIQDGTIKAVRVGGVWRIPIVDE